MAFSSWFRHSALFSFHCILGLPMLYWLSLAYIAPVCLLTGTAGMWLDSVDSWLLRRKPVFAIGRWRSTQTSWRLHMNHCGISARRASPLCVPNVVIQRVPVYMSQKLWSFVSQVCNSGLKIGAPICNWFGLAEFPARMLRPQRPVHSAHVDSNRRLLGFVKGIDECGSIFLYFFEVSRKEHYTKAPRFEISHHRLQKHTYVHKQKLIVVRKEWVL